MRVAVMSAFALTVIALAACGGRVQVDATSLDASVSAPLPPADGGSPADAGAGATVDSAAPACDGGAHDPTCTAPVVNLITGDNGARCLYDAKWSCGGVPFHVIGAHAYREGCDHTSGPNYGFRGVCIRADGGESTFSYPTPGCCSCTDPSLLAALVAKECGFPTP